MKNSADNPSVIRNDAIALKEAAISYFMEAHNYCIKDDESWHFKSPDYYFSLLPEKLVRESNNLRERILSVISSIFSASRKCPLIQEEDRKDLSNITKTMRAAIRLRQYRQWDAQILSNEDMFLGVQRAGQSEEEPLSPEAARKQFLTSFEGLINVIDLLDKVISNYDYRLSPSGVSLSGYRPNTAFIIMAMDPENKELDDVLDAIKEVFLSFGIEAKRADDIEHQDIITKKILDEITTSQYLFADLTGERPSVYYEIGYAHAIERPVILFRKKDTRIHFDLAAYNCPEYENLRDLKEQLSRRIEVMTNKKPLE